MTSPDPIISPATTRQLQSGFDHSPFAEDAKLAAGLYIVSTPIGNLRDITLRALDILANVDHILAEDTRQTAKLLAHYKIKTPLSAYHDHNAAKRVPKLVESLQEGAIMALVSDAGTPLVSDPGYKLVSAAIEAGIHISPIPGASAVLAALTLSGCPSERFSFGGFLPPKITARKRWLETYLTTPGTLIFFETGPRLLASLSDIETVLGNRPVALTRELTKRYEEARYGSVTELMQTVKDDPPRGELVICIGPSTESGVWDEAQVIAALTEVIDELGVKRAATAVAQNCGWKKRDVYALALRMKDE
ncbi:MAG: 16S rRNA (cytidine(1402)-2'-O)-methyltransferase [Maricaulaceae bacterium]